MGLTRPVLQRGLSVIPACKPASPARLLILGAARYTFNEFFFNPDHPESNSVACKQGSGLLHSCYLLKELVLVSRSPKKLSLSPARVEGDSL